MPADYSRIHRLLRIITLIQSGSSWNAARLAEEFGVAERTIYRDLDVLEHVGIPYSFDEERRGYRLRRDFFMPPVDLTLDEALALVALGEHVAEREQVPMMKAAARAIMKVRSALPARMRDEVARLDEHIAIDLAAAGPHDGVADVYERIRAAISSRRALECRYESLRGTAAGSADGEGSDEERFEFRPYVLYFAKRAWYAIGWHGARDEVRTLKLNRFSACVPTDRPYEISDDFSLRGYLGNAWRMIGGPAHDVELRFEPEFAETVAETIWHSTQEIEPHADGSVTFRCRVDGLDEIVWWVMGMGPHCRVLQPRELADRVQSLARGIVDLYSSDESTGRGSGGAG